MHMHILCVHMYVKSLYLCTIHKYKCEEKFIYLNVYVGKLSYYNYYIRVIQLFFIQIFLNLIEFINYLQSTLPLTLIRPGGVIL